MKALLAILFVLLVPCLAGQSAAQNSPITVARLRTEYTENPLGIDVRKPRLGWEMTSKAQNQRQTAYRILVASSATKLKPGQADVWDSGRIASDQSQQVVYDGPAVASGRRYYWSVQVWDQDGKTTAWSAPSFWEMGLLDKADWKGSWIAARPVADSTDTPNAHFRKTFRVDKPVRRARLYITSLGIYRPFLNGERIGSDDFTPGWTDYRKRVQYQTYDVSTRIHQGENALGVLLGDGWYAGHIGLWGPHLYGKTPQLLAQLEIEHTDGSVDRVVTNESWRVGTGPIVVSDILMGEDYDARREIPGWNRVGFNDRSWKAAVVAPSYTGLLVAQYDDPVRVTQEIKPVKVTQPKPGTYVVDMGQNMVGWVRMNVRGQAGQTVQLRFAEMLNPDGTIYTTNLRSAKQTDRYTLRGSGNETYEPTFTFHGFRYVEVTGYPGEVTPAALVGRVAHSATPRTGTFETNHAMLNQLQSNIWWGQRGNFVSIPTDCPQRDERLGWMGDAQIFVSTAAFNADVSRFFTKWMTDVTDAQRSDGAFTDVSPDLERRLGAGTAGWGDAGVIVPWTVYLRYGDKRILETNYPAMKRWVDYLVAHSDNLIRPAQGYGDWLSIAEETPKEILATAYMAHSIDLVSRVARVLGHNDDAQKYEALFGDVRAAFNRAFVQPDGEIRGIVKTKEGNILGNTQTGYVLALYMNLLPQEKRQNASDRLVSRIQAMNGHLSTGFLGVGHLMPALSESGRLDVAYQLLFTDTYPSWFYPIHQGATTIWERWDGWTEAKGFQDPGMNSFNHYSLGSVGDWMYRNVAGIDMDPSVPGYKKIVIKPRPGGPLTHAKAEYQSLYGPIRSEWTLTGGRFVLDVAIPVNTTAVVLLPDGSRKEVGSGTWKFESIAR